MDCATLSIRGGIDGVFSASKKTLKNHWLQLEKSTFVADAQVSSSEGIRALQQKRSLI